MGEAPSLWPYLIPALPGLIVAAGTALGLWWNRRGVEAAQSLTIVQIDVAKATVGKTEAEAVKTKAEAESLAVSSLAKALEIADKTIDKLEEERDGWRERAEKAERWLLEQEMKKRLESPKSGNGKGN